MKASHTTSRSKINEMLILKLNTMNLMKLMMVGLLLSSFLFLVTGCSDNDDSGAKVLLRPVATMEVVQNKAYIIQSPNQKIPDRKTKCVIKTHINIKQNVIFGAKLKPV